MTTEQQLRFWGVGLLIVLVAMYFLSSVLLPFAAGMAVAYLLDPTCDKLESWGLSRGLATVLVTLAFVLLLLIFLLLVGPLLINQLLDLLQSLPRVVDNLHSKLQGVFLALQDRFEGDVMQSVRESLQGSVGKAVDWFTRLIGLW